jgi:aminoglycoside N3'-acetyltransferase
MINKQHPLTYQSLLKSFRETGIAEGMMIEVHSSLSSLGYVEGGAETVIKVLMQIVGESGALIMPAFPVSLPMPLSDTDIQRGLTYKIRKLDPDSFERSGMGIIPDTFRRMPGVLTGQGEHRVIAWGRDADINCKGFSNLIEKDGHALLIGVDIYRLTSMHYMEANLPDRIQRLWEAPDEILKFYPKDEWYIQTGTPTVQAWYTIQNEAYKRGLIVDKKIGNSKCMFFKVNDVIRIYEKALETDPFSFYGIKK